MPSIGQRPGCRTSLTLVDMEMSSGAPDHSAMITYIPIHLPGVDPPVRGTGTLGQPLEERQVLEAAVESPVETPLGVPRTKTRGLQDQHAVKTSPSDVASEELGRLELTKGCLSSHR